MKRAALLWVVAASACGVSESEAVTSVLGTDLVVTKASDLGGVTRVSGNLLIHPAATVIELRGLLAVQGSVIVSDISAGFSNTGVRVSLPDLTNVGLDFGVQRTASPVSLETPYLNDVLGHLRIEQASAVELVAPRLKNVHGDLRVTNSTLGKVDLSSLGEIDGAIILSGYQGVVDGLPDPTMTPPIALTFPSLTTVTNTISLSNGGPTTLSFPALNEAGGLEVDTVNAALQLPSLEKLDGTLRVRRATLDVTLDTLTTISGDLQLEDDSIDGSDTVELMALDRVEGGVSVENVANLVNFEAPVLTHVGSGIRFTDNSELAKVSLGLQATNADIVISGSNASVVTLDVPTLLQGQKIVLSDNQAIALAAPRLSQLSELDLTRSGLKDLDVPVLKAVTGAIVIEDLSVSPSQPLNFPRLSSAGDLRLNQTEGISVLSLPQLQKIGDALQAPRGSWTITDNQDLIALTVPNLESVVLNVTIANNPVLVVADALLAGVMAGGEKTVCGNSGGAACGALPAVEEPAETESAASSQTAAASPAGTPAAMDTSSSPQAAAAQPAATDSAASSSAAASQPTAAEAQPAAAETPATATDPAAPSA